MKIKADNEYYYSDKHKPSDCQHITSLFVKHGILGCKRAPFTTQKTSFQRLKDGILEICKILI